MRRFIIYRPFSVSFSGSRDRVRWIRSRWWQRFRFRLPHRRRPSAPPRRSNATPRPLLSPSQIGHETNNQTSKKQNKSPSPPPPPPPPIDTSATARPTGSNDHLKYFPFGPAKKINGADQNIKTPFSNFSFLLSFGFASAGQVDQVDQVDQADQLNDVQ